MTRTASLHVEGFFDPVTGTVSYLALDTCTGECALIDSVLDYDGSSGRTTTHSADKLIARVGELGATVRWLLETHVHADHLSAAPYLKERLGGQIGIGQQITTVQQVFGTLFNTGREMARDGSQFDRLFADGDTFALGGLAIRAIHTPGHTPACMTYVIDHGDETAAFVGDTLFMPDYGTARCDFPGGDAATLFRSIARVLSLPDNSRLYMCHDYLPGGRTLQFVSTVAEQRADNIHVRAGISEAGFVAMRTARDATLAMPTLLLPSVQVNMRAGHLPQPEDNGTRYLKIPLNVA
ncbi:glyoxylase-like metal-dependent hydrolase (beta-lactamase superfamily II) [Actimicrobium sp. GrIS 1.19]|uniref:MBL fold metallo-hydrolase n=1 Tax=Actimicrobium sp. GrIS 1.19 TaxID=3071708 RepID=UPI002E0BD57E|nr:glyoxylase-like metal-dependent hydrolase (beta-lactamase superfamily II) [Actimicrobium sp. GrIS 1.19]